MCYRGLLSHIRVAVYQNIPGSVSCGSCMHGFWFTVTPIMGELHAIARLG